MKPKKWAIIGFILAIIGIFSSLIGIAFTPILLIGCLMFFIGIICSIKGLKSQGGMMILAILGLLMNLIGFLVIGIYIIFMVGLLIWFAYMFSKLGAGNTTSLTEQSSSFLYITIGGVTTLVSGIALILITMKDKKGKRKSHSLIRKYMGGKK